MLEILIQMTKILRGRVDGVVTEPRPPQTRACALTHSVPHMTASLMCYISSTRP